MARSSRGGTRGLLKGTIGKTLFQIRKSDDGSYYQLVSQLPESKLYTNTIAQAINRLSMGCLERAMNCYRDIIDCSFENVAPGMDSFNEFVKWNYPYVRDEVLLIADAQIDPSVYDDYNFDYPDKGVQSVLGGTWQLGAGSLIKQWFGSIQVNRNGFPYALVQCRNLPVDCTVDLFCRMQAMRQGDFYTFIFVCAGRERSKNQVCTARVTITDNLASDTVITADNVALLFNIVGNIEMTAHFNPIERAVYFEWIGPDDYSLNKVTSWDYIYKRKINGQWRNCACSLQRVTGYAPDLGWHSPLDVWPTWV